MYSPYNATWKSQQKIAFEAFYRDGRQIIIVIQVGWGTRLVSLLFLNINDLIWQFDLDMGIYQLPSVSLTFFEFFRRGSKKANLLQVTKLDSFLIKTTKQYFLMGVG